MATARHAHELEAAGDVRWTARIKDGLVLVKDEASGQEVQATAYTVDADGARFQLPGEGGLRLLRREAPGYDAFAKVLNKASGIADPAVEASQPKPAATAKAS